MSILGGKLRCQLQGEATLLRGLPRVGDGVFEDLPGLAVDNDLRALEGDLEGVAIHLLEQGPSAAEGDVLGREALFLKPLQDLGDGLVIHAIALNQSDVIRQDLVSCRRHGDVLRKLLAKNLHDLHARVRRVPAVRADDQAAPLVPADAALDHVLQLSAPVLLARRPDVEGVAYASYKAIWVLLEHIPHRIHLALYTPGGDR
mmetsp:Transcript_67018/g.143350  ORF Transcript_67018/g.143350 Transcript_67018/m.143350 type:complete len:202 (-) Transcript_67018:840-1445(-)